MKAQRIAEHLGGRRSGDGWMARCPAHDDRTPSLSIHDSDRAQVLVHCLAGCDQQRVIASLRELGLWPSPARQKTSSGQLAPQRQLVDTYPYEDEKGELLYEVERYEWEEEGARRKSFQLRRKHPHRDAWVYGIKADRYEETADGFWRRCRSNSPHFIELPGVRPILYRLREVLAANQIFVVEGEKDVETLRGLGRVATTNSQGAGAWTSELAFPLRRRDVILIPDNDAAGWKRVLQIARDLVGHAARLRVLELEGAKDFSEWIEAGHSIQELEQELSR